MPGDRGQAIVQIELREALPIAQSFELLAIELVGEIDHTFSTVVEFQPNLVVTEIPRIYHLTGHMLVLGHLRVLLVGCVDTFLRYTSNQKVGSETTSAKIR